MEQTLGGVVVLVAVAIHVVTVVVGRTQTAMGEQSTGEDANP